MVDSVNLFSKRKIHAKSTLHSQSPKLSVLKEVARRHLMGNEETSQAEFSYFLRCDGVPIVKYLADPLSCLKASDHN